MKKMIALFSVAAALGSISAFAAPAVKVTDVWTCPMTGEAIKDHKGSGTPVVVGNYRVHFCCGGCPEAFAKLTDKQKKAKIASILKKDQTATGAKKS